MGVLPVKLPEVDVVEVNVISTSPVIEAGLTVADNASGSTIIKPASFTGDVDITFTSTTSTSGSFTGNTPTNQIFQNAYTIDDSQSLSIASLDMTKVAETSWGDAFVVSILGSQSYNLTADGKLWINTGRKTFIFIRL